MIICPFKDLGRYAAIIPGLDEALKAVSEITDWTPRTIPLSGGNRILVQDLITRTTENQLVEAHRNYLDIQYMVEGDSVTGWAPTETLTPDAEYNADKDAQMFRGDVEYYHIREGHCFVVWPEDAHMPDVYLTEPNRVRKLVLKLKIV